MQYKYFQFAAIALATVAVCAAQNTPTLRMHTNVGDIDVVLTPDVAPLTVANFMTYVNSGAYNNTLFHRSVAGFVIQAGGYALVNHVPVMIPSTGTVKNEFNVSNTVGTIAMAQLSGDPNSATNQWFFNLANNTSLDTSANGPFTVFGHIANAAGLKLMNTIGGFQVYNLDATYGTTGLETVPLNNFRGTLQDGNFVLITSMALVPALTPPGFESAASYALNTSTGISPGEILVIYGQSLGPAPLTSFTVTDNALSNTLAGTQVMFNGKPGAIIYTSATQTSVIVPYSVAGSSVVNVNLLYQGQTSNTLQFPVVASNPAAFTLNSSGKGDAAIVRLDASIVSTASPAAPGDILELFGEGYGVASPVLPDGALIGAVLPLPVAKTTLLIDGQPVDTLYAGAGLINGVLQINFRVPQLKAGSHSLQIQVGDRISPAGVNLQTR